MARFLHITKENMVYIVLWAILFIAPLVSLYIMNRHMGANDFDWRETWHIWKLFLVYLVIFLIHNYFLAPLLVYKHSGKLYIVSVVCLLTIFTIYNCISRPKEPEGHHVEQQIHDKEMAGGQQAPHQTLKGKPAEPFGPGAKPKDLPDLPDGKKAPKSPGRPPFGFVQADFISLLILVGLLSLNLGVKIFFKTSEDRDRLQELEKQSIEQQLAYLKYQISPHFFMNTLNNIHALVDINPEMAKSSILELSKMMRYLLYEADKPFVPLQRELQFIENYISLMRLRYTDRVEIVTDIPKSIPDAMIPPLLTINLVENAFKHGVSYQEPSFIHIKITLDNNIFSFDCINSKHKETTAEKGGVGLTNAKKRLDLLFGENYTMETIDQEKTYEVSLQFPMTPHTQERAQSV